MSLIRNERLKLSANAVDRASTACFTVGIATPAAGYLYNVGGLRESLSLTVVALGFVGWFGAAVALHLMARRTIRRLA